MKCGCTSPGGSDARRARRPDPDFPNGGGEVSHRGLKRDGGLKRGDAAGGVFDRINMINRKGMTTPAVPRRGR